MSRRALVEVSTGIVVAGLLASWAPPARAQADALAAPNPEVPDAPPPPPVLPPPPALPPASPPAAALVASTPPEQPLAGVSDSSMFLRAPDGSFVFFPSGRVQVDAYHFSSSNKTPNPTFLLRRARLELAGWIGSWAFFNLAGDFAAGAAPTTGVPAVQSNLNTTDDFVALAPRGTIAMLQVGQFDAPFTLENRTSDKYFDFMERSITVRAFAIPTNKEMGAMVHGYNDARNFMYSVGVFNGDGQNYKNLDDQFDFMGRAWVAPFSFMGDGPLRDAAIGGSFWTGDRGNTLAPVSQTTQGGFTFLNFGQYNATVNGTANTPVQLRQVGRLEAFASEVNVPVAHTFGVRNEVVWRHSPLAEDQVASNGTGTILGGADLKGWSTYTELWYWALGDDRIIGDQQGLGAYPRFKKFGVKPPQHGVMLAFRFEYLDETVSEHADAAALTLGNKAVGTTKVESFELGVNYWYSKRFRMTRNYVFNHFSGTTAQITGLSSPNEQEFLLRLAVAL
jgi:phosphate-selective porin